MQRVKYTSVFTIKRATPVIKQTFLMFMLLLFIGQPVTVNGLSNAQIGTNNQSAKAIEGAICGFETPNYSVYLPFVTSPTGTVATPAPMVRELQYMLGQTYIYDYQMSSISVFGTVDANNERDDGIPNETLFYGQAHVSITGMEGQDVFVGQIALNNPVLCATNGDGPDEFVDDPDVLSELQTPILFKQHKNGQILEVQISNSIDPVSANFVKGVINSLQTTLEPADNYMATETGGQGTYEAQYTARLQANGVQLSKTLDENSFTELHTQGDEAGFTLENTVHTLLERETGVLGSISFYETMRLIENEEVPEDGVGMWGYTKSNGLLTLTAVESTPTSQLVNLTEQVYQPTTMGVIFDEMEPPTHGIDMATIDLDAELDALEADPTNPALFQRMIWIITADRENSAQTVLNAIATRLMDNLANEPVAKTYIDLLGHEGSSFSQSQLIALVDASNGSASLKLQEHIIISLALVETPDSTTYNLMTDLINDSVNTTHKNIALTAIGAMASSLDATDPETARLIYDDLEARLALASTDEETHTLLIAIGNTENPSLVDLVSPYLADTNEQVQWAAYWALRDIPGPLVDDLLISGLDPDKGLVDPFVLPGIVKALKNRPPNPPIDDALDQYFGNPPNPVGGIYKWGWNRTVGNDEVGGSLPGELVWKSPPYADRLEVSAHQSIKYKFDPPRFGSNATRAGTLGYAHAWLKPKNATMQEFGYVYTVFGKTFNPNTFAISCANNGSGEIVSGNKELIKTQFEYPVWWILSVGVELSAVANYGVDYSYSWDVCNLVDMSGEFNVIPYADLHATASGYGKVLKVFRGGVELQADIIDVKLPVQLSATYNTDTNFEACADLSLELKALDLSFYTYAEEWFPFVKWVRFHEDLVWNKQLLGFNKTFLDTCWSP